MVIQNKTGGWKPPSIIPIEDIGSIVAEPSIPNNIFDGFKPEMNAIPLEQPDDSASMNCKELKAKLSEMEALGQVARFTKEGADKHNKEILAIKEKLASCKDTTVVESVKKEPVINAIKPPIITSKSNYLKPVLIGLSIIAAALIIKKILK